MTGKRKPLDAAVADRAPDLGEPDERDERAAELRRAGVPLAEVRKQLGYESPAAVVDALARVRAHAVAPMSPQDVRDLELERLDRLQMVVWAKAMKGDLAAVAEVRAIGQLRLQLVGPRDDGDMLVMFNKTVAALDLPDVDAALVAAGRRIATKIDAAAESGDHVSETKALYLVPHLMTVLRELGATPAAREALKKSASVGKGDSGGGKLHALRAAREGAGGTKRPA